MSGPHERLAALGIELPQPPAALAAYLPFTSIDLGGGRRLVHVAGQVAMRDGKPLYEGPVPDLVSVESAQEAARLCAVNVLAQLQGAGGLENVEQICQLTVYVLSSAGFGAQPQVANAASELLTEVLGVAGRHARAAVGVNALPLGVPVEVSAVAILRSA